MRLDRTFASLVLLSMTVLMSRGAIAGAYEDALIAARDDRTEAVIDLVERGLDPNTSNPSGTTLLMMAAENGNAQLVESLLTLRAKVSMQNRYGDTAIALAALSGHDAAVRRLADAGAQLDGPGWGALHYAAFNGHAEIVRYLIAKGARLNLRAPNRLTALMLAARNGHEDVVKILLGAGADPNVCDLEGNTAIDIALKAGNENIAGFLRVSATQK
jgi:uncharacterized protein